jgi:putative selenium metabolism protein SsnA
MLLKGAQVASLDPPLVETVDLRVEGGRIVQRARSLPPQQDEEVLGLGGMLVLPGLVNAHTHLYSALARGMPAPASTPRNFVEVLERVWWKLDRALDEEAVYLSALVGGIEAALSGTTFLIDHHSSPSFITGSLRCVKRALEEVGLRSVLCYEVTDRNGEAGCLEGVQENVDFQHSYQSDLTRGMIGAHASFTLTEETMQRLAGATAVTNSSLHIHVAEDAHDVRDCATRYGGESVPQRLGRHGLLASRTLMAHCVHLTPEDIEGSHSRGAWIAHNARSNMNNAVGYGNVHALRRAALGTDGVDQDMLAEARAAFLKMQEAHREDAFAATLSLLAGGHRLAAALFGLPFGKVDVGGPADLVILDYTAPTPVTTENVAGHLLFGVDRSHVRSVLVAGRFVVRDRRLANVDAGAALTRARDRAPGIWSRMQGM